MTFDEVLIQVRELLEREGRVAYRILKRRFELSDEDIEDLKADLIDAKRVAADEDGKVLVWAGAAPVPGSTFNAPSSTQSSTPSHTPSLSSGLRNQHSAAERRQLTVMFVDLVGSTALSAQLDPEDYRAVVQHYHQTCDTILQRHAGHVAQPLGDGLLVYFGHPVAHEDDAHRAVRAGLEIVEALQSRARQPAANSPLPHGRGSDTPPVRIGIHTGLVVIGEIGGREKKELLALGETPNLAARIQGLAEPNTVLISAATQRLLDGQFECQPFGSHLVKGIATPIAVYHVQSERQQVSPLAGKVTLTPLVGREQEVGLLLDRWAQVKEGRGHVVLLSGEPGIGKSRLAYTLREHVTHEGSLLYEARCSPYHQQSALYPLIDLLQRTLLFTRQDTDAEKVAKLERALALYEMPEMLPLFTALLSLPTPANYPALNLTPQKQKERTLQALLQLFTAQAERQATVFVWEDVHWADPSSLEFLTLLIDQIPTTKLLLVLTFRPEFTPPWKPRSHLSHLVLNRLGQKQVEAMIAQAASRLLSSEVIEQIRLKTDGVPLFVEELTKSVVEAVGTQQAEPLLTIPATLQDALMARLDRLAEARQIAQLGATLGREFSYELLHAVAPANAADLQTALAQLVEAEILYQRGVGEHARYFFKHALIQDTAYQSLLKSTRQHYHQQIAQVLEKQFPNTKDTQPELLAHHYTEAGLIEQAIPYWQQAGQRAGQRSAYVEAISHLSKGVELLKTLPDMPKHIQSELTLQIALGTSLMAVRGYAALEVGQALARARELCGQVGDPSQRISVLWGLMSFYTVRDELQTARELAEYLVGSARDVQDPILRIAATHGIGAISVLLGEFAAARKYLEQGMSLYDPQQHHSSITLFGEDLGVSCLCWEARALFSLGYPEQALKRSQEAFTRARELSHPTSLGYALANAADIYRVRRDESATQERAEALLDLAAQQGFALRTAQGTMFCGWALAMQGKEKEGIAQLRQGLAAFRATGAEFFRSGCLALLAEVYEKEGQAEEGLAVLVEALDTVNKTEERFYEAELYRIKGELTLKSQVESPKAKVEEAESCFLKAIDIAQKQQAKSWELRASTSLARLWQRQGKKAEAHELLSNVYNWFTEGFDTKDLQEAKALLEELTEHEPFS